MPTLSEILPIEQADVHRSPQGTVFIWRPAKAVLATRVEGVLSLHGAMALAAVTRRVVSEDRAITSFHDWYDMTDYETASRVNLTRVASELRSVTTGVHFVLRSKVVALGVQAANLVLGIITVHPTREALGQALRTAMEPRHRGAATQTRG